MKRGKERRQGTNSTAKVLFPQICNTGRVRTAHTVRGTEAASLFAVAAVK